MGKRGIALILGFMVILVLSILATAIVTKSVSESRIAQGYTQLTQAFWIAEAGVSYAVTQLIANPNWTGTGGPVSFANGTYEVVVQTVPDYTLRREITSTGSVGNSQRRIKVIVDLPWNPAPGLLGYAIETTGNLIVRGSIEINPRDSAKTQSDLTFEEVFGADKETIKAQAGRVYNDPPANQQPVDGITWVDLTGDALETTTTYVISSNWSGSGLLIIDGNRISPTQHITALEITGDWTFNGMIWVMGKIMIAGNPTISGGIFAESAVDVDSSLSGNATINYSAADIQNAFGLLAASPELTLGSWQEVDIIE